MLRALRADYLGIILIYKFQVSGTPRVTISHRSILLVFFISAITLGSPCEVSADQLNDGAAAYISHDYATALRLLPPVAESGDATAQVILGSIYMLGQGTTADPVKAVGWFRRAAEQGDPKGQGSMAVMYYKGFGVPQDYLQAYMWSLLAISRADANDAATIAGATKWRDAAVAKLTPEQVAEGRHRASDWVPKVAPVPKTDASEQGGPSQQGNELIAASETMVAGQMRDPEGAKFNDVYVVQFPPGPLIADGKQYPSSAVCGWVNAKNAYGAYVGRQRFFTYFLYSGSVPGVRPVSFAIEPLPTIGESFADRLADSIMDDHFFPKTWATFCGGRGSK